MATLTIDLNDETLHRIEQAARKDGSSVTSWAGRQLAAAARPHDGWPDGYFETIASFGPTVLESPQEVGAWIPTWSGRLLLGCFKSLNTQAERQKAFKAKVAELEAP